MGEKRSLFREYAEVILIASGSMETTLLVGDHLFVDRYIYGPAATGLEKLLLPARPVQRGDIVVFRSVENPSIDVVKRCIGLPGDEIRLVRKQLFLNGKPVADDGYTQHTDPLLRQGRDTYGPFLVPDGHFFCMGDNRDESRDSRYWGPLPQEMIKGRAVMVYWSYGGETPDGTWRGFWPWAKRLVGTMAGFFTKTRWDRTFQVVH
jgi:signal peptidase I